MYWRRTGRLLKPQQPQAPALCMDIDAIRASVPILQPYSKAGRGALTWGMDAVRGTMATPRPRKIHFMRVSILASWPCHNPTPFLHVTVAVPHMRTSQR